MKTEAKQLFNESIEFNKLDIETQEELLEKFETEIVEAGWEDWMDDFSENEELTEKEIIEIEKEQARRFINSI